MIEPDSPEPANQPESEPKGFDELDKMADSGELTAQSLQQELAKYRQAYEEEFEAQSKIAPENCEQHLTDFFKKNLPELACQVIWLAHNAQSESVRLSAIKFGIGQALADAQHDGDPIKDLISKLQRQPA